MSEAQVIAATDAELGLVPSSKPRGMVTASWEVFAENRLALAGLAFIVFIAAVLLRRPVHLRDQPDEHRPDQLPVHTRRARTCSAATTSATTSSAG